MDFTKKNTPFFQKFSELTGKNGVASMEIIADGTQANENPAAAYRGLGCITANNSSRLLLDYKVEHPREYEEIMRLLFQKDYGIGLSHIKIELGADINSSSGTEPATKRSAEERADVTRGAGFQFAADAKAINPDITLDLLRWGEPGWVARAFTVSQEHGLNARYMWYKETLDAAYQVYGLKFDFISADQNETDTADETWILFLRHRLDHETNTPYDYSKIKLIASDEVGTRNVAAQMVENNALRNAIDVIGLHYTTYGDSYTNLLNEAYGKEIWYSEGIAPCNLSEFTVQADQSGIAGRNGAIDVANRIINSYYNGKMCMYEFQPAIASYYDGSCYAPKHLIRAWEPWSGHYRLDSGFWMAMHFSRFSPKGWLFVNGACYGDGEENHAIENTSNNFMTLVSPDRSEMTMHFTNEDLVPRTYSVLLKDMGFTNRTLSTIVTTGPNAGEPYDANWFRRSKPIKPSHKNGETYFIKVPPQSIMTITTLDTSWVNGVETFTRPIPASERLPLPYQDNFQYHLEEIMVRGCAPRYTTDQGGAFELIHSDQDGDILCQRITKSRIPSNWRFRSTPDPITCLGDDRWRSYSAEVEVRLDNRNPENYAGLGIRYNSSVTCETTSRCGYIGMLFGDGSWRLMDMDNVAAEGKSYTAKPTQWNKLKLLVLGDSIFFFLNGDLLTTYRPQCPVNSGRISLCSDYEMNTFRKLSVQPMPVLPLYVRRVDCFSEEIFYNDYWEVCPTESYHFYHRTSMKALEQAAFSCQFTGTGIAVLGTAKDAEFQVTLDDNVIYDNLFVPYCAPRQACLIIDQLEAGTHTLQVTLKSGAFKLDVLEIPESYAMIPDTLALSSAALSAAEEHAYAAQQKALAKQKAAADAAQTLEKAVEALREKEPAQPAAPKNVPPQAKPESIAPKAAPQTKPEPVVPQSAPQAAPKPIPLQQVPQADMAPETDAALQNLAEQLAAMNVTVQKVPNTEAETVVPQTEATPETDAALQNLAEQLAAMNVTVQKTPDTTTEMPAQQHAPQTVPESTVPQAETTPEMENALQNLVEQLAAMNLTVQAAPDAIPESKAAEMPSPTTWQDEVPPMGDDLTMTYIEEEWENFTIPEPEVQPKPPTGIAPDAVTPTPAPAPKATPMYPPILNDTTPSAPFRTDFDIDINI